jgi:hypothetical protein
LPEAEFDQENSKQSNVLEVHQKSFHTVINNSIPNKSIEKTGHYNEIENLKHNKYEAGIQMNELDDLCQYEMVAMWNHSLENDRCIYQ